MLLSLPCTVYVRVSFVLVGCVPCKLPCAPSQFTYPWASAPADLLPPKQLHRCAERESGWVQLRTQHPLRERAKKLDQGILVIRFEMPFNVFCACGKLIGKVCSAL